MPKKDEKETPGKKLGTALGGIFSGLTELVERLNELAEKGEELKKTGALGSRQGQGKDLKGVYGFSFKVGLGGEGTKVEPFGNVRKDESTGESVIHELREPITDVFEEADHLLIVAEMPGVDAEDIRIDIQEDILTLNAEREDKKYHKELLLPGECRADRVQVAAKNGIVEIKCMKG